MKTSFIFLFGPTLSVMSAHTALNSMWQLSSNQSTNTIASLSQKMVAMTLPDERVHLEFVLRHPAYSPDLTPYVFHLFGSLKNALQRCCFVDDDDKLKHSMHEEHTASHAKVEKVC
jgi:hypothetical protein